MPGARPLCPLYADLYKKCVQGKKIGHMKICDDYVFMLKSLGCAYHYYDVLKLDKKYKMIEQEYHSER